MNLLKNQCIRYSQPINDQKRGVAAQPPAMNHLAFK